MLPLAVPVFVAMAVGPLLSWKRAALAPALVRLWWAAVTAAVVGLLAAHNMALLPALAFAGAAWMICGAVADIAGRIQLFRLPMRASLSRLVGLPLAAIGAAIAHAGLGVTVIGIAGMSMATDRIALVRPGESISLAGYQWQLLGLREALGPNYTARIADLRITRDGVPVASLSPERRTFPVQRMTTTEAKIHTNLLSDLYAVLGEERDGGAVLRLHYNPLAPWIWLGALVMAFGGMLSLVDRRLRTGAPVRSRTAAGPASAR